MNAIYDAAAEEPPRSTMPLAHRWLHAVAWLHDALSARMIPGRLDKAAAELGELMTWEDRQLLIALLLDASAEDGPEVVDWLSDVLQRLVLQPEVRFGPVAIEAESWAALASEAEIKAWLMACIGRLPSAERLKFVAHVQRQTLAAAS